MKKVLYFGLYPDGNGGGDDEEDDPTPDPPRQEPKDPEIPTPGEEDDDKGKDGK